MTDLAKACIYFRARNNLTQAELARKCGVDRCRIIDVEHNRKVSMLAEAKIRIAIEAETD